MQIIFIYFILLKTFFNQKSKKVYFYLRPETAIIDNKIDLYLSVNPQTLLADQTIAFNYDFNFNHILVNQKSFKCLEKNNCFTDKKLEIGSYQGKSYQYQNARTFVGINYLSPAEINKDQISTISQGNLRLVQNDNFPNVIGFGPQSDIFTTINDEYFLYKKNFNITFCNYETYKHFRYYSKIDSSDLMKKVDVTKNYYQLEGYFSIGDQKKDTVTFGIGSAPNHLFSLEKNLYQKLKIALCVDVEKCENYEDLKNDNSDVIFRFKSDNAIDKNFSLTYSSLYDLDQKGKIQWKFRDKSSVFDESNSDIILEGLFFARFYLLLSKNYDGPFYIGLRRIIPTDFWINNLWKYLLFMIIFCILFLGLGHFAIMMLKKRNQKNKKRQKLIQYELKEFEDHTYLNDKNKID